jgi:hypothetical protein
VETFPTVTRNVPDIWGNGPAAELTVGIHRHYTCYLASSYGEFRLIICGRGGGDVIIGDHMIRSFGYSHPGSSHSSTAFGVMKLAWFE